MDHIIIWGGTVRRCVFWSESLNVRGRKPYVEVTVFSVQAMKACDGVNL